MLTEKSKAYLSAALIVVSVWGVILSYAWYRNTDAVKVDTSRMTVEQLQLLEKWME